MYRLAPSTSSIPQVYIAHQHLRFPDWHGPTHHIRGPELAVLGLAFDMVEDEPSLLCTSDPARLEPFLLDLVELDALRAHDCLAEQLAYDLARLPVEHAYLCVTAEAAAERLVRDDRLKPVVIFRMYDLEANCTDADRLTEYPRDALQCQDRLGVVAQRLVLRAG